MIYVLFHSADLDGHCSGAIVRYKLEQDGLVYGKDFKLVPSDYGQKVDPTWYESGSTLYFVDYTIQPYEVMLDLLGRCNVIVYDHHKSPIEFLKQHKVAGRYEVGTRAACEIIWEELMKEAVPEFVKLLSDYDNWNSQDKERWETKIFPFQYGMRGKKTDITTEEGWEFWESAIGSIAVFRCDRIIEEGKAIITYQEIKDAGAMSRSFDLMFEGRKFLAINGDKGSPQFKSRWDPNKYDGMLAFILVENKYWTISLYTDRTDIDLSVIAQKWGGGGHMKACGFQVRDIRQVLGEAKGDGK